MMHFTSLQRYSYFKSHTAILLELFLKEIGWYIHETNMHITAIPFSPFSIQPLLEEEEEEFTSFQPQTTLSPLALNSISLSFRLCNREYCPVKIKTDVQRCSLLTHSTPARVRRLTSTRRVLANILVELLWSYWSIPGVRHQHFQSIRGYILRYSHFLTLLCHRYLIHALPPIPFASCIILCIGLSGPQYAFAIAYQPIFQV